MTVSTILALLAAAASLGMNSEILPVYVEAPQEMAQLMRSPKRSYIGVSIQTLTAKLAKANGNKVDEGALVNDVERKSPADSAGIAEGDVIVQFGDRKIYDADDLQKAVSKVKPGTKVNVMVDRKGSTKTIALTVGKNPNRMSRVFAGPGMRAFAFGSSKAIGANLHPLGEQLAEYFQIPGGKGVLVESVESESAADKAGMKAGDVIVKIGSEQVEDIADVWEALGEYEEGETADIEVIRKGASKKLSLEIEEGDEGSWFHYRTEPHGEMFDDDFGDDLRMELKEIPRIRIEKFMPDMDRLKFDMDRLRDDIRFKVMPDLPKLKIERKIREKIRHKI
ncbi:MAG TPA: PDZ domain-containing protein [Bacteroidota bacterium]